MNASFLRIAIPVAATVLVMATLFAAAVFFGLISLGSGGPARAERPPAAASAGQARTVAASAPATAPGDQLDVVRQQTFGDWLFGCIEAPETKELRCLISQSLTNRESNGLVFLWRIMRDGNGRLVNVWRTPNGVQLTRGIAFDVGRPEPIVVPFQACGNGGCRAVATMTPEYVAILSQAEKVVASVVTVGGQKIDMNVSVNGLANGLAALQQSDGSPPGGAAGAAPQE